jgi:hypothetical protein
VAVVFKNNANTVLASDITSTATSISVLNGSVFPSLSAGEYFLCTLDDDTNNEIIKVTAISGNTLTVERAQEGTTARAFSTSDTIESRVTAGIMELFPQLDGGEITADILGDIDGAVRFGAKAGEALTKGDLVYVSGVSGDVPVVSKAKADDVSKMPVFGLAVTDANNNAELQVATFGTLDGLDTSGVSEGQILYASTTAGAYTTTKPTGESSQIQNIGKVIRSHATAGSIKIGGAGRSNDVPNLNNGKIFLGNGSNQAVSTTLDTSVVPENTNLYYTDARAQAVSINNVVEDTSPQLGGNLDVNGNAITGSTVQINGAGGELMISATENGPVALRYDNNLKLTTKSDGVDITGELQSDSLDVDGNADILGNLTISGTVDGRDIATDGTKLDTIETNADVTDTTNVTAAGALMDSEITNLAQVKAFDSSDYATAAQGTTADSALQNIVEDTTPQLGGDLASNGNLITFGDSSGISVNRLKFGDDLDLQIYHTGLGSYITESGTGSLSIRGTNLNLADSGGNIFIEMTDTGTGGTVEIKHNASTKLTTTATGIDVTGTATMDGLTVDGTATMDGLTVSSTLPIISLTDTNTGADHKIDANSGFASLLFEGDLNSDNASGGMFFRTQGKFRLGVNNGTGDISFYEDTGTTAQMTWDASADALTFTDNTKAIFGAGSDLQIYHDGAGSYIDDSGDGSLYIRANNLYLQKYTGETYLAGVADSSVYLYYNGLEKLRTLTAGIDVTGEVVATSFSDGTISGITFIDEDSFTTNSATRIPTQQSVKSYVDTQVASVVDSAPAALDTLNELAAALGDDANFSTTTSTALGNRLRVDTAAQGLTGTQQANAITNLGITATKAELNYVDGVTSSIQTQLDGKQASGSYLTGNQTITLSGDVSGSGTTSIAVTIADDSHNHVISNVDGLQTALDAKLPLAGGTLTGSLRAQANLNYFGLASTNNEGEIIINTGEDGSPQIGFTEHGDVSWAIGIDDADNSFKMHGTASNTIPTINNLAIPLFEITTTAGTAYLNNSRIFTDAYHPNADTLTTARTISLTGAVTGSVSFNGSSNVSIATTATADPTLTLSGDASGSATFTNLGNATLSVTVADDSHNHIISNVDGLQTALDAKLASSSYTAADVLTKIKTVDGAGSGLDADLLDGHQLTTASTGSTVVERDASGDINCRLLRSEYDTTNSSIGYIMTQVDTGTNNYVRPSTPAQVRSALNVENGATADQTAAEILTAIKTVDGAGSGLDADLLDGISSASFLRSDATDTFTTLTGTTLTVNGVLSVRDAIDLADNDILRFGSSDDVEFFCNGSHMYTDLNSGIGNWYIRDGTTTRFTFDDAGDFTATGNVTAYSDERLKDNILVIDGALEKVSQLRGVTFNRTDTEEPRRQTGVIAQEVEKVLPEAVITADDEMQTKSVAYGNMVGLLIEAIKEQQIQIDDLKQQLNEQKEIK